MTNESVEERGGDLERPRRIEMLLAKDPARLTEEEHDELERAGHPRPGQGRLNEAEAEPAPPEPPSVRVPRGQSREQLQQVQARNQELLDGAEASSEGER